MPTLGQYRSTFSVEAGEYIGPDSYVVRATGGSTTNQLVCDVYPIQSGISQMDKYVDRPIYRPYATQSTDQNRVVMTYDPPTGTLTPDLPWSISPTSLASNRTYQSLETLPYVDFEAYTYECLDGTGVSCPNGGEIGEHFEILGPFDVPTTHRLINDGLKNCWLVVEVACLPTTLKSRHDLSVACPWLQDPNDVLQVGVIKDYQDRDLTDPFENVIKGMVERDGGTFYLNTGTTTFVDGDVLWLRVLKRAYDHCRAAGGTFGDQSGLYLEDDESPCERNWVASSALLIAWRRFAHLLEPGANQRLIRDQAAAAAWFTDQCRAHFTAPLPQRTLRRRRYFGPPQQLAGQYWG